MQEQENLIAQDGLSELPEVEKDPLPKKKKHWTNHEEVLGWVFSTIPIIGFLIFGLIPLVLSFYIAFNHFPGLRLVSDYSDEFFPYVVSFVGFENFGTVLKDPEFWQSILNTLFVIFTTLVSLALSIFISMMLYHCKKGKKLFQTVFFIPYVCSMVAVTFMWQWVFN